MTRPFTYILLLVAITITILLPERSFGQDSHDGRADNLYQALGLDGKMELIILKTALKGFDLYTFNNDSLLTIIDYSKASHQRRMFVIDLKNEQLLYHILVAHGKNSGVYFAEYFSNKNKSLMSSPGFYRTAETYFGKHGYSLKLDGLEEDINDHARERLIVIHGADYVSDLFIEEHGRIGRSWGCPALPLHLTKEVINLIKDGSCLFIYTDDESYPKNPAP